MIESEFYSRLSTAKNHILGVAVEQQAHFFAQATELRFGGPEQPDARKRLAQLETSLRTEIADVEEFLLD